MICEPRSTGSLSVRVCVNGQVEVPAPCGCSGQVLVASSGLAGLAHAVGVAAGDHDGGVVQEAVEDGHGGGVPVTCGNVGGGPLVVLDGDQLEPQNEALPHEW